MRRQSRDSWLSAMYLGAGFWIVTRLPQDYQLLAVLGGLAIGTLIILLPTAAHALLPIRWPDPLNLIAGLVAGAFWDWPGSSYEPLTGSFAALGALLSWLWSFPAWLGHSLLRWSGPDERPPTAREILDASRQPAGVISGALFGLALWGSFLFAMSLVKVWLADPLFRWNVDIAFAKWAIEADVLPESLLGLDTIQVVVGAWRFATLLLILTPVFVAAFLPDRAFYGMQKPFSRSAVWLVVRSEAAIRKMTRLRPPHRGSRAS